MNVAELQRAMRQLRLGGLAAVLETRLHQCASTICSKYLNPPKTTDFAVLFLPTDGFFAVIRRDGLAQSIQRECRVVIAGTFRFRLERSCRCAPC